MKRRSVALLGFAIAALPAWGAGPIVFRDRVRRVQARPDGTQMVLFRKHAAIYSLPKEAPAAQRELLERAQKESSEVEVTVPEGKRTIQSVALSKK